MPTPRPAPDPFPDAARFAAQRGKPAWSAADEERFQDWLASDQRHAAVFAEAVVLYGALGDVADPHEVDALLDRHAGSPIVAATRSRSGRRWLAAAAIFAVLTGGLTWWSAVSGTVPTASAEALVFTTTTNESRQVVLPDGSRVDLDADTQVQWRPDASIRRLSLDRGRAVFSVTHDAQRPFVVTSGVSEVRVLGTVFSLDARPSALVVAVAEGRVRVQHFTPDQGTVPVAAELTPGRQAVLGRSVTLSATGTGVFAAWRSGRLDFEDRPMGEVLAELQRYTTTRLEIADPSLAALRLTGAFDRHDPDAILTAITRLLPVTIDRGQPGVVRLSAKNP